MTNEEVSREIRLEISGIVVSSGISDIYQLKLEDYQRKLKLIFGKDYSLEQIKDALDNITLQTTKEEEDIVDIPEDYFEGF